MKTITVYDVARATKGDLLHANPEKEEIKSLVTMDSRLVKEDSLFVAIKGERVDGHDFLNDVFDKGATAAIVDHVPDEIKGTLIVVKDTVKALQDLAEWYRESLDVKVVGITGSVGKTSTKEVVASVLSEGFKVQKTAGNYNNEIGLPLTVLAIEEDTEIEVLEMGISDFGEMTRLSKMVRPDVSVITNIGYCHLEKLGDRDGVLKAKTEMFNYLKDDGKIVLCHDDDKLCTVEEYKGIRPIFYGTDAADEYYADKIEEQGLDGVRCTLHHGESAIGAAIPAVGRHNVLNALCAMAVGQLYGLTDEQIAAGIASFQNVGSRNRIIKTRGMTVIDDCYNANPTSTKAGLNTLAGFGGRRVAVLGDMKELGRDELALHKEVGAYAKEKGIDLLVAVGGLSKATAEGFGGGAVYYPTVEDAAAQILSVLKEGDTALVKASRSMHLEKIVEMLKEE